MLDNLRQIIRDVRNVRRNRQRLDLLTQHVGILGNQHAAAQCAVAAWQAYAERGERRYVEAMEVLKTVTSEASSQYLYKPGDWRDVSATTSDAVKQAWAIGGWTSPGEQLVGAQWADKQKAKRDAIDRQNATVGLPPCVPNHPLPMTWGARPGVPVPVGITVLPEDMIWTDEDEAAFKDAI